MKIIVGLGNPGLEYNSTRHNIGFLFLDYLKEIWNFEDFKDSKFKAIISEGNYKGEKCILVKPMTYMNLSGESLISVINFYKLDFKEDIIVIYDDISMDFGKMKFRVKGSAGGHNGIKSITSSLGSDEFKRIKIGVGLDSKYDVSDWVLSKFTKNELQELKEDIFSQALELLEEKIIS
ncbi:MAG: aminoacyl-tRNA hydrolase [Candidatus Gracilibacteria bacterium]|nr:aminoacyl-tRNA hydrolase [Candidatus Gracilibacteria bacterium]MDD2908882.1 aminoacyl-tRNA hydrolase [Candidatus Gracilibacteria bacterium]